MIVPDHLSVYPELHVNFTFPLPVAFLNLPVPPVTLKVTPRMRVRKLQGAPDGPNPTVIVLAGWSLLVIVAVPTFKQDIPGSTFIEPRSVLPPINDAVPRPLKLKRAPEVHEKPPE